MNAKKKAAAKAPTKKTARVSSRSKATARPQHSDGYDALIAEYAAALELLRSGDYEKAREAFLAVAAKSGEEPVVGQRAQTYVHLCERRLAPGTDDPDGPDDLYYEGVRLANEGRLDEALSALDRAIAGNAGEPTFLYARASVRALQGAAEAASEDLRRAIESRPELRFQAVNDPDFDEIRDQAAFIDVIEPTPTGA